MWYQPSMFPEVEVTQPGRQAVHLVLRDALVLGRDCEGLLLADAQVSRRHMELRPAEGRVLCTDLGSTNGSFLDGERISAPVVLVPGNKVTIGGTTIRLATPKQLPNQGVGRTTTLTGGAVDFRRTSIDEVADLVASASWAPKSDAGTLTILFSDIESHTEMVTRVGDTAWFELLEFHNELFRGELALNEGREIKSQGDGFMLTFRSVRHALTFARSVQEKLARQGHGGEVIRVRMGLHTGEVITDASGDVFGRHVIKAARIANLASGGQILASETVREIAQGDLAFEFGDAAVVPLKGLEGHHAVHDFFWSPD